MKKYLLFIICLFATALWSQKPDFYKYITSVKGEPNFYEMRHKAREYVKRYGKPNLYNQYRRQEWYLQSRLGKNGAFVPVQQWRKAAYDRHLNPAFNRMPIGTHTGAWSNLGPIETTGGTGLGRVNRIMFHPTDPNILYASTAGGGLWISDDLGVSWNSSSEGLPVINTCGIAIHPTVPDTLYLLTGDGDGWGGSDGAWSGLGVPSVGVVKSTDGGETWAPTSLVFSVSNYDWAYNLTMHPSNPRIMFVSARRGLYYTDDGWDSFTEVYPTKIYETQFKPGDPSTVYAVDDTWFRISSDGGLTWPDSTMIDTTGFGGGRMSMGLTPAQPNWVYIVAGPSLDTLTITPSNDTISTFRGLFLSVDSGSSFGTITTTPNYLSSDTTDTSDQSSYDLTIAVHPTTPAIFTIGGISIWYTNDTGTTFSKSSTHADIHHLNQNPLDNSLYAATDGGLYRSTDFGQNWDFLSNDMSITQYYRLSVHPTEADFVLAGSQDNGSHFRETNSTTFDRVSGKDGMDCSFHPMSIDTFITGAQFGQFYITEDGGSTMTTFFTEDTTGLSLRPWIAPVTWDPTDVNTIYIGYKPMYKTTDMGQNWVALPDTNVDGRHVMGIGTSNPNRLYAGSDFDYGYDNSGNNFSLFTSGDGGASWDSLQDNTNFPRDLFITDLVVNPTNSNEVWITCGGWDDGRKVYRSTNTGSSWTNMSMGLPNVPFNAIAFRQGAGLNYEVYAGGDIGVYYLNDTLGDWIPFSNNLPNVEIADLEIQESSEMLRAATYGRGIWESGLYINCPIAISIGSGNFGGKSRYYQASDNINSQATYDSYGQTVFYKAGAYIDLLENFNVQGQKGAAFRAFIGGCSGGVPELIQPDDEAESNK